MRKLITGLFLAMIVLAANAQTVETRATWVAPTSGSPVDRYILQLSEDGGPFYTVADTITTTSIVLDLENLVTYVARVAGVDALDRQGPWSVDSDPYTADLGIPGQPSQPIIMEP